MFEKRLLILAASALLAIPLVHCADPVQAPDAAAVEVALLTQRIEGIASSIRKEGRAPTETQIQEITRLNADIRSWQSRTGRTDIRVSEARHVTQVSSEDPGRVKSSKQSGPVNPFCTTGCPSVPDFEPLGKICILTGSSCRNGVRICTYTCYDIDRR